jgi:replicative DNA helicase Mcm
MIEPDGCATDGCAYKKLELVPKRSTMTNQQKLNVQEHGEDLRPGQQPQAIDVIALDDECDKLYPGDRATLNCIVRMQQRVVKGEKTTVFDIYLDLSSVEIEQSDFEEVTINEEAEEKIKEIAQSGQALEIIAASIAPSIYGYTEIKKGAALQMFGGVTSTNSDGSQNRGEIHIAVLGDPGVAKSRLIKYIARQSPRGVFVSSVTSSGVGLTGAATRDEDGRWIIEAGALPLADKGVGAIDEIDKADPDTIDSLLNIMEDGEVRIAKAGQNRLLKARCSIIVAGNPKEERFDTYAAGGLADQINLPPAFLSRFDLIYLMVDQPDAALDAERSKHVIKTRYIGECKEAGKPDKLSAEEKADTEPAIPTILLKQYIAYAKRKIFPIMNEATRTYLTKHYVEVRSKQGGVQQGSAANTSIAPPTMRQQEALVRMAEASARMRLSPEVTLKDAERAVALFDQCLKDVATDPVTGKVDMGRIGQGMAGGKLKLIHAIKDIIRAEDGGGLGGVSVELIISKLDEKGFKGEHEVEKLIEELHKKGDLMQPKSSVQKYKLM